MDNDVSRYWVCDREDEPFMERCEDGDWVYFEDYASLAAERDALRTHQDYDLEMLNSLLDYIERVEKTEHGMDGAVREIARRAAALRGPTFRSVRVRSRSR